MLRSLFFVLYSLFFDLRFCALGSVFFVLQLAICAAPGALQFPNPQFPNLQFPARNSTVQYPVSR
jgi:hypothetical protein